MCKEKVIKKEKINKKEGSEMEAAHSFSPLLSRTNENSLVAVGEGVSTQINLLNTF